MSRTLTILCDRCQCEVNVDLSVLRISSGPLRDRESVDLCLSCARALLDWLAAGHTTSGEATTPSSPAQASLGAEPKLGAAGAQDVLESVLRLDSPKPRRRRTKAPSCADASARADLA